MPTCQIDPHGPIIAESLVIAQELDNSMSLNDKMLISAVYQEVIQYIGLLIWADLAFPGVDRKSFAQGLFSRMTQRFSRFEQFFILKDDGLNFSMADHFLGEGIDAAIYAFGNKFVEFLSSCPKLSSFYENYHTKIREYCRPQQFTGRPQEANVVKELRELIQ